MRDLHPLHPRLRDGILKILSAMSAIGFPMMVTDTLRTIEEQQKLYAQGRTTAGPNPSASRPLGGIVTNADGVVKKSNHQAKGDGFAYAVDCCFLVGGKPSWDEHLPWKAYGSLGEALGFAWGGNWPTGTIHDLPHLELLVKAVEGQRT